MLNEFYDAWNSKKNFMGQNTFVEQLTRMFMRRMRDTRYNIHSIWIYKSIYICIL